MLLFIIFTVYFYTSLYTLSFLSFFFFNDTATTEIYTLSLHDALPISIRRQPREHAASAGKPARASDISEAGRDRERRQPESAEPAQAHGSVWESAPNRRSEEHTSELQSHLNLVCRLLLEKKKKIHIID